MPTAVLIVNGDTVYLYGDDLESVARHCGARRDRLRDCWTVDRVVLGQVTDTLDRLGYVWACEQRGAPRLWAQWLFAELPEAVHSEVYQAVREVLVANDECQLHCTLLDLAWEEHPRP
jgi:hypothetical protein